MVHNVIVVLAHTNTNHNTGLFLHWIQNILHSTDGYLQLLYISKERMRQNTCSSKRNEDRGSPLVDYKYVNLWVKYLKFFWCRLMKWKPVDLHPPGSLSLLLCISFLFLTVFIRNWALCKTESSHTSVFEIVLHRSHH